MDTTIILGVIIVFALLYFWFLKRKQQRPTPETPVSDDAFALTQSPDLADAAVERVFWDIDEAMVRMVFDRYNFIFSKRGSYALQPDNVVVEELVRKIFPADRQLDVLAKLNEYGHEEHEPESGRVRVGIIKASGGNHQELAALVAQAKSDFRDVIVVAEEPNYFEAVQKNFSITESITEPRKLQDADLRQFVMWLLKYM